MPRQLLRGVQDGLIAPAAGPARWPRGAGSVTDHYVGAMRRALPALLLLVGLTGCGGGADPAVSFSEQVRGNFLTSCIDNAKNSSNGAATEEQVTRTCECILGKVEQEYSEAEFAQFEKRLLGNKASDEESARLVDWSSTCAREATAG